jgi:hypothetical protein
VLRQVTPMASPLLLLLLLLLQCLASWTGCRSV